MPVAGPDAGAALRAMMAEQGIAYHPQHQVTRVESGRAHFADGAVVEHDLLVYVPPIRPPRALNGSGLVGESGWVQVDRHTMETAYPGVHAVGDVTLIPLAMGKPLPRAGVFAHAQAEVVARRIAAVVRGRAPDARFDGLGACFIETGDGRAGYDSGDFYAEPAPVVRLRAPGRLWHWGKVAFEQQVLRMWL